MEERVFINNLKKQDLKCGDFIFFILKYLEDLYGYKKMCEIVEPLGIDINYLEKKDNWVSYEYLALLLQKLVDVTKDEKAPLKAFIRTKNEFFFGGVYLNYPLNYFTEEALSIKFKILLILYHKISNIAEIEFIISERGSLKFILQLKKNITKNFILALKGIIISILLEEEKKFYKINALLKDQNKIQIEIYWDKYTYLTKFLPFLSYSSLFTNIFLSFFLLISYLFYPTILPYIGLTLMLFSIYLIINLVKQKNEEKQNLFDYLSSIKIFKEVEKDHTKKEEIIAELSENNRVLSVINKIGSVEHSSYFNTNLFEIAKILIKELNFNILFYYEYVFMKEKFDYVFEFLNKEMDEFSNFIFKELIEKILNSISFEELIKKSFISNSLIQNYKDIYNDNKVTELLKNYKIFLLPIEIPFQYRGIYFFLSEKTNFLSDELIEQIFQKAQFQIKTIFQNISTRRIIEDIISNIPNYILIFDRDDLKINFANNLFYSSFPTVANKLTKEEIINTSLFSILELNPEEKNRFSEALENLDNLNFKKTDAGIIKRGPFLFECLLFKIPSSSYSKLTGLLLTDITDATYFQRQLILNEKLISLGKVASSIAHEINNPLYGILANAEEIARINNINKKAKKYAEEIVEFVVMISDIIKDLSAYSKTFREEEITNIDLNETINDSIKMLKYSKSFLDIKVIKKLSKVPKIKARKGELQQVFINLFNNAIQAMNGTGTLTIKSEYHKKQNSIFVTISDTGVGIKEEIKPYIFDLFFTTKKEEGTGLGLHITKKILEKYNCEISFDSKEGEGTTFYLNFKI